MKITLNWLYDFLDTNASLSEICSTLTQIGHEVEEIIDYTTLFEPFKVAQIIEVSEHPNANKLSVCKVDTGREILQIVCGGNNVRLNMKVVLAPIGSIIPTNQMKMCLTKIRGVNSQGMLLSLDELGIGESNGSIIDLPQNAKIGYNFATYLGIDEQIIDLAITPNRGDCLSIYGIARDLAAAGIGQLKEPEIPEIAGEFTAPISLTVEETDNKFMCFYIKNVKNAESPEWLQNRLRAVDIKVISCLVDITNYVMLSYGRPLHAYDADKIRTGLTLKKATKDCYFTALDNNTYQCLGNELIIADENNILGFAGIIGGDESKVTEKTKNIILESGYFPADKIALTGRHHKIITDARYRFERGVDYKFVEDGAYIAAKMILNLCGGNISKPLKFEDLLYKEKYINIDYDFFYKLTSANIGILEFEKILTRLKFIINKTGQNYQITVPSYRHDLEIKQDVVEEVIRLIGYDKLPTNQLPKISSLPDKILSDRQQVISRCKRALSFIGYFELVTWSFMSRTQADLFVNTTDELVIENPINSELNYMRPTIIANLLTAACKNKMRGINDIAFFEIGNIYSDASENGHHNVISALKIGNNMVKNPHEKPKKFDVYDIKQDLEYLFNEYNFDINKLQFNQENTVKWLHPGRSASLKLGKNLIGYFGELHPQILKAFDLDGTNALAYEIYVEQVPLPKIKKTKKPAPDYSDFQTAERDFAFVMNKNYPASDLIKTVKSVNKNLIKNVNIFDIYMGKNIGEGKKSIAFSVTLQAHDRTLVEKEISDISKDIIHLVSTKFGAHLRDFV